MVRIKDQILYGNLDRDSIAYFRDALAKLSKELLSEKERIDSLVKFIDTKGYKLASENQ